MSILSCQDGKASSYLPSSFHRERCSDLLQLTSVASLGGTLPVAKHPSRYSIDKADVPGPSLENPPYFSPQPTKQCPSPCLAHPHHHSAVQPTHRKRPPHHSLLHLSLSDPFLAEFTHCKRPAQHHTLLYHHLLHPKAPLRDQEHPTALSRSAPPDRMPLTPSHQHAHLATLALIRERSSPLPSRGRSALSAPRVTPRLPNNRCSGLLPASGSCPHHCSAHKAPRPPSLVLRSPQSMDS